MQCALYGLGGGISCLDFLYAISFNGQTCSLGKTAWPMPESSVEPSAGGRTPEDAGGRGVPRWTVAGSGEVAGLGRLGVVGDGKTLTIGGGVVVDVDRVGINAVGGWVGG